MWYRPKQRLIEQLVAQAADEGLCEGILHRLSRRDVMPSNLGIVRPLQDAFEVNSVPLSLTIIFGLLRLASSRSTSRATRMPEIEASGRSAKHSSCAIVDHDQDAHARPSMNWSATKSSDQRSFGSCGTSIGARVPRARLRPPRGHTERCSSRRA